MQTGIAVRDVGEKVYLSIKNVAGATITKGYAVAMRIGGSFDGINAVLADSDTAADLPGFIGVAVDDIADTEYGPVQAYGIAASVYLSNEGSSITINDGDPLVPGALAGGLTSAAPTYANGGFGFILASNVPAAVSAVTHMSGFVRCLH